MKINRKSWHYKVSNLFTDYESRLDNLCVYFWRLIGTIVLFSVLSVLAVIGVIVYFVSPFIISTTIMVLFIVSSMVLPVLAIYYFREKFGTPEIAKANLLFDYIKAKKKRVCPLIEYHD